MSSSPVTLSVFASPITAPYTLNTKHPANETAATALNIGDLEEQGTTISISDGGLNIGESSSSTFTLQQGDTVSFNLNSLASVIQDNGGNSPRVQISDSNGNVIADNEGTLAQQQAFVQLSSTGGIGVQAGLSPGAGTYTVTVTPPTGSTGIQQATINTSSQQGSSLNVNSTLTSGDPAEYYNFSLGSGNNLKLAFDAGDNLPGTRVQLYNSSGSLIADSAGNVFLENNYVQLTSATGLGAQAGNYQVVVSYSNGTPTDQNLPYNFQLYSGNSYSIDYITNATAPAANNTAAGSVTPTPDAQVYSRSGYNSVAETPTSGVNIGWIQQDKTALSLYSQLTSFNNTDYYNLTLQTGNNLKLAFNNTSATNASNLRVQVLNATGTQIIADNYGSQDEQAVYAALTSSTGIIANPGQYIVKVGYPPNGGTKYQQDYNFQVFSGTSYSALDTTTTSAQTYENALLSGSISGSYTANGAAAAYLSSLSNGITPDVISALAAGSGAVTINSSGVTAGASDAAAAYLNNNLSNSTQPGNITGTLTTLA